jgi:hypothetical protein
VGDRSRGRFATPADSPLHDGTPYSHVHVRRESLGFVPRSRTVLCRAVPNLSVTIRNFFTAVEQRTHSVREVRVRQAEDAVSQSKEEIDPTNLNKGAR